MRQTTYSKTRTGALRRESDEPDLYRPAGPAPSCESQRVTAPPRPNATSSDRAREIDWAARRLYDAEIALHIAHQTRVDAWISAAADRLHEAIVAHAAACAPTHNHT